MECRIFRRETVKQNRFSCRYLIVGYLDALTRVAIMAARSLRYELRSDETWKFVEVPRCLPQIEGIRFARMTLKLKFCTSTGLLLRNLN